jgi:predicted transposase YbfD/YdcC
VLAQVAVGDRENELTQAPAMLAQMDLANTVVTGDALFAQRSLCEQIVGRGGHYLFAVKENQLQLQQEIARSFR